LANFQSTDEVKDLSKNATALPFNSAMYQRKSEVSFRRSRSLYMQCKRCLCEVLVLWLFTSVQ